MVASANTGDIRDAGLIPGQEDPLVEEMAIHSSPMDTGAWLPMVCRVTKNYT